MTIAPIEVSQEVFDLATPEQQKVMVVREDAGLSTEQIKARSLVRAAREAKQRRAKQPSGARRESEADFASWFEDLLNTAGWKWCHFRPARVMRKDKKTGEKKEIYETPIAGPGGKGLPDYHIWHEDKRLSFWVELKSDKGDLSGDQKERIESLQKAGELVFVFRPKDRNEVETLLA